MSDYFMHFIVQIEGEPSPTEIVAEAIDGIRDHPEMFASERQVWDTLVMLAWRYITSMERGWPDSASGNHFARFAEEAYLAVCAHLGRPPYTCGDDEEAWK